MSLNGYKKDCYGSPRHLSILRESPEDMFLSGERSEDIYVNFDDRSIINNSPLPARPNKAPPPLPSTISQSIQPVHPPVPIRKSSNPVTMVTASTQTNRGTCIEGNVPDILAFTLNSENSCNINEGSPTHKYDGSVGLATNYDCMGMSDIAYPTECFSDNSSVDLGSYITKFIEMMHDPVSWYVDSSGDSSNYKAGPTVDISRFEMRRNAEKEFYNVLKERIDIAMSEYYLRVFGAIKQIRNYCETLRVIAQYHNLTELNNYLDYEPGEASCELMKMSFNENYRRIICSLGGLEALAQLIVINHNVLGDMANNYHLTVRRYTCMALTNLTFGIGENKSLLCSIEPVLLTLVDFLSSCSEEVKQVAASVIRNLSWKADEEIKLRLKEANISKILTTESMKCAKESCLKSVLSALWNISSHCRENKIYICEVPGALAYFVDILSFKTIALVESSGGILRNISGVIATNEKYRIILRQDNAFQILLKHLRSSSLTVVGNACGTLCSLSSECQVDQQLLWDLGAVGMLKNLIHSKHKTISIGSASTLKNLISARASLNIGEQALINALKCISPNSSTTPDFSPRVMSPIPSLHVRKLNALETEIECILRKNQSISFPSSSKGVPDIYSVESPSLYRQALINCTEHSKLASFSTNSTNLKRSDSDDSIVSAHSDLTYDKVNFQSINQKLKLDGPSKISNSTNNYMSLSDYSNSTGHYDLTVENCMKISNLSMNSVDPSSTSVNYKLPTSNLKKRIFHAYPEDYDSDNSEKPLDYSRQFGDSDEYMTYPTPIIPNQNDQNQLNPQLNIFRTIINIPPPTIKENPKVYATEGTPVQCGSRMSPLSEEIEERNTSNMNSNPFNVMQIIHEDSRCFPLSKKSKLENIEERINSVMPDNFSKMFISNENGKSNKCVKFEMEPPHIINDTPLMFSRSSSIESLDSFETHSFHSSVQSEYSRLTSQVVSPCELLDSPASDIFQRSNPKLSQTTTTKKSKLMSYLSSLPIDDNGSIGNSNTSSAILQKCIESGMPVTDEINTSNKRKNSGIFSEELESAVCYAVEHTPYNYSTEASSLSNISISDPLNDKNGPNELRKSSSSCSDTDEHSELLSEIIQSAMPKGINNSSYFAPIQATANYTQVDINAAKNCSTFVALSNSDFNESYPNIAPHKSLNPSLDNNNMFYGDIDSPRQYVVEGTPNSLSQRDSICSETNLMLKISSEPFLPKPLQIPPKPPKRTTSTLSSVPEKTVIINQNEEINQEELHVYMTENTPANYSRESPISHLSVDTPNLHEIDNKVSKENYTSDSGSNQESKSLNDDKSSLSSLSIESAGMERTLLQQCISSAMPAPKLKQPSVYNKRNHSSDQIIGSKNRLAVKSELQINNPSKSTVINNSGNINETSVTPLNIESKSKIQTISKWKKTSDYKSSAVSNLAIFSKSKVPEPKTIIKLFPQTSNTKSFNESSGSNQQCSTKPVNSYTKSKSSCSLKSVLRYNTCVSTSKENAKNNSTTIHKNETEKNIKEKSNLSKNCYFLENGFDASPIGLAASNNNVIAASPGSKIDEFLDFNVKYDKNAYSTDNIARHDKIRKKDNETTSDSDTLELIEITGLMHDDFLKDESSSLEIDAARYCNAVINESNLTSHHDTDEDLTDNEFNDAFTGRPRNVNKSDKTYDIMKDGVNAVLSTMSSQGCTNDQLSTCNSEDGDSLLLEMEVSNVSSTNAVDVNKPKGRPRIVKPTIYNISSDNDSSVSSTSIGIRGGRKSLTGRKSTKENTVNSKLCHSSLMPNKRDTCQSKISNLNNNNTIAQGKGKIVTERGKPEVKDINTKTKSVPHSYTTKVVNSSLTNRRSSLPKLQNKNTLSKSNRITGLSTSNIMLRTKFEKKTLEERKRARSSTELRSLVENNVEESNLNESIEDDEDNSEGVWLVRKEICPQTVFIK